MTNINVDLIANLVICGLFFGLGFFISTVLSEKRHFRLHEKRMKEALQAAKSPRRSDEDMAELDRLRGEVKSHLEAIRVKDGEIEKLAEQIRRSAEEHAKFQEGFMAKSAAGGRSEEDTAELERLCAQLKEHFEAMKNKDAEIEKLAEQIRRTAEEQTKFQEAFVARAGEGQRSGGDSAETEKWHTEVMSHFEAMKKKDDEIVGLLERLSQAGDEYRKLDEQLKKSLGEEGQLGRLHKELSDREAELREKTDALADAQEKCKGMSGRCEEAEKILADYGQFEKNIQAQKKSFQDTEQRIREMKIKLRVLSEKAKENVEALARFAESKEFDEFRKSVHLDELTQKYEDQVKDLSRPSHPQ